MTVIPAEWSPHRAMWVGLPSHGELWEENLEPAQAEVAALVRALAGPGREQVRLLVGKAEAMDDARARFADVANVEVVDGRFGDIWLRDTGPIFDANGVAPRLRLQRLGRQVRAGARRHRGRPDRRPRPRGPDAPRLHPGRRRRGPRRRRHGPDHPPVRAEPQPQRRLGRGRRPRPRWPPRWARARCCGWATACSTTTPTATSTTWPASSRRAWSPVPWPGGRRIPTPTSMTPPPAIWPP